MEVVEVRVKLEVSLILAAAAATLFGVIMPGSPDGLDVLNDPSARPIPSGLTQLGGQRETCKGWLNTLSAQGTSSERDCQ